MAETLLDRFFFDFSSLPTPSFCIPPLQALAILPRTDKGETEERINTNYVPIRETTAILIQQVPSTTENPEQTTPTSVKKTKKKRLTRSISEFQSPDKLLDRRNKGRSGTSLFKKKGESKSTKINEPEAPRLSLEDSIAGVKEIEKKLENQEKIVAEVKAAFEKTAKENPEYSKLENNLQEQETLLNELRMHLNNMKDQYKSGYLKMRICGTEMDTKPEFVRYWFYLNYPKLCCYDSPQVIIITIIDKKKINIFLSFPLPYVPKNMQNFFYIFSKFL